MWLVNNISINVLNWQLFQFTKLYYFRKDREADQGCIHLEILLLKDYLVGQLVVLRWESGFNSLYTPRRLSLFLFQHGYRIQPTGYFFGCRFLLFCVFFLFHCILPQRCLWPCSPCFYTLQEVKFLHKHFDFLKQVSC